MPQLLERAGTVLAERYVLERELGHGGMATVYLGRDLKHSRRVAVKVLRPELAASLGPDRFLREIDFASHLTHPHILPLHDSGDAGGLVFYVMPFVEGESLRERLQREGTLPVKEVVRIAGEVAEALDFAHTQGIVHRDVKPGNILLVDGHAVVADFGIAKAVSSAGVKETSAGLAIGTPAYMSPEQILTDGPIDGRADLYSLGCVVYEMLAGHPPFVAATVQAVAARHIHERPPGLRTIAPSVPESIERAVAIALEKQVERRFATAGEFVEAMAGERAPASKRWWRHPHTALVAVGLVLAGTALALAWRRPANTLDPSRIVIFPVTAPSSGSNRAAREDVALALVASLNSTGSLTGIDGAKLAGSGVASSRRRASLQGAAYYVDATLVPSDSLRLVLDLHDLRTGGTSHRAVAVPSQAGSWALGVRAALELLPLLIPSGEPAELPSLTGRSPAAMAEYFMGERDYRRAVFSGAVVHFRRAVAADSSFGLAALRGAQAASWAQQQSQAEALVRVALADRDRLPNRHREFALGMDAFLHGKADSAMARFRNAVALDPAAAESWMYLGETYNHLLPRASPLDSLAERAYLEARARDSAFAPVLFHLIDFTVRRGDREGTRRLVEEYRRAAPDPELLGAVELELRCIDGGLSKAQWEGAAKRHPSRVFMAAQTFALGGLRQPACARAALESLSSFDATYRFGALIMLHGLLVAQGRHDELRVLLSQDTLFDFKIRGQLHVLAALAGAKFAAQADSFVERELLRHHADSTALSNLELWFVGSWAAHRGQATEAAAIARSVLSRAGAGEGRRDTLLAASLAARAALAAGDSAGALAALRALIPTTPSHQSLTWDPWESLGGERLLLARLLLARGRPLEAYEVAANFDSPVPIPYLMYLPASLDLRIAAARQLGDLQLAERSATRLEALRSHLPPPHSLSARDPHAQSNGRAATGADQGRAEELEEGGPPDL